MFAAIADGTANTRSDLMRATGLSRSTVTERLDALFEAGLVKEADQRQPSGGRPSKRIVVNEEGHLVLAADLGEDHSRLVVTDLAGHVLGERVGAIAVGGGPSPLLSWIAEQARELVAELGRTAADLLGLGLAVPAPVDFARGQVVAPSVMTGWDGVDIQARFRELLDIPVLVENDVNARGFGEYLQGWQDYDDVLYIKAGTGLGSAILTGHDLYRGAQGAAGDIGHIRLEPDGGPLCRCGAIGCVEAIAAGWAIVRDLAAAGMPVASTRDAIAAIRDNDPIAIHRVREAGRVLGRAIAYTVNMLNPSLIIVGGSLTAAGDHLMLGIRESVYQYSLPLATRDLRIVPARGDDRRGAIGMAHLIIKTSLQPTQINGRIRSVRER
ncbi:MAG: ROK family transcriptional regulator [Propionicimonas sp.]|nr:ROK family transcriptional regulator [Propionicimonas sp.]